jgi:hypothetical protein
MIIIGTITFYAYGYNAISSATYQTCETGILWGMDEVNVDVSSRPWCGLIIKLTNFLLVIFPPLVLTESQLQHDRVPIGVHYTKCKGGVCLSVRTSHPSNHLNFNKIWHWCQTESYEMNLILIHFSPVSPKVIKNYKICLSYKKLFMTSWSSVTSTITFIDMKNLWWHKVKLKLSLCIF